MDRSHQPSPTSRRLLGRRRSVHDLLGGSRLADNLLWRDKYFTASVLAGATALWTVFQWYGCHVLSLASLALLLMMPVLFVWSNVATFVNRTPPSVPRLQLSEAFVINASAKLREAINGFIAMLHEIASGKDIKLFLKVEVGLWLLSATGRWCSFLTLLYIVTVLTLTVPALYERHEEKIERNVQRALRESDKVYDKLREQVTRQIPRGPVKEKRT